MAKLFSTRPSITFKGRQFKGLRGWAGKPLHPPLTDFPIVCYVLAGVFDVISYIAFSQDAHESARNFFVASTYVIVAGGFVSLGAILTGLWDWWKGVDRDFSTGLIGRAKHTQVWRTINWHMFVMLTVTAVVAVDIAARVRQFEAGHAQTLTMVLSIVAALLVSYGSLFGGSLVFDYQFNVEALKGSTAWDETEVDQSPAK